MRQYLLIQNVYVHNVGTSYCQAAQDYQAHPAKYQGTPIDRTLNCFAIVHLLHDILTM
jgi:hypothetical protein